MIHTYKTSNLAQQYFDCLEATKQSQEGNQGIGKDLAHLGQHQVRCRATYRESLRSIPISLQQSLHQGCSHICLPNQGRLTH